MSKLIQIAVSPEHSDRLVRRVRSLDGVIGATVQPSVSVRPRGDLITVWTANQAVGAVLDTAAEIGILEYGYVGILETTGLVAPLQAGTIAADSSEHAWEEMDDLLRQNTRISFNYLALMACSGALTAIGLLQDQLYLIIAGMLVASGFEPLVRLVFAPVMGNWRGLRDAFVSIVSGYAVLFAAAILAFVLLGIGSDVAPNLAGHYWVGLWSKITWAGALTALISGFAGGTVTCARETVFATGVMVAVALIPSMTIAGLATAFGDYRIALEGLARWASDAGCVLAGALVVALGKQLVVHRRRMRH